MCCLFFVIRALFNVSAFLFLDAKAALSLTFLIFSEEFSLEGLTEAFSFAILLLMEIVSNVMDRSIFLLETSAALRGVRRDSPLVDVFNNER